MPEYNNHNNDPLEDLFRKKAREHKVPYREEDWRRLEVRLDRHDKRILRRNWQRWLIVAIILIIALFGYVTYTNYTEINRLTALLEESQLENKAIQPSPNLEAEHNIVEKEGEQSKESSLSKPSDNDRFKKAITSKTGQFGGPSDQRNFSINDQALSRRNIECDYCLFSEGKMNTDDATQNFSHVLASENTIENSVSGSFQPGSFFDSRFALGLVTGPDLSTVGSLSDFQNPGYIIGFVAEWKINNRFSISTGLLQSKIKYKAQGSEYNPPEGYWTEGIIPDHALGVCYLLDIPINVMYTMRNFQNSKLYAKAGISSYIMLSEDYRFIYNKTESQYGLKDRWTADTGNRYWLNASTLSLGYEWDLKRNTSVRIEPFLKVPLRDVGWGNVQLYSIGSLFSINYRF